MVIDSTPPTLVTGPNFQSLCWPGDQGMVRLEHLSHWTAWSATVF